jgi:putative DNA primase/helicase
MKRTAEIIPFRRKGFRAVPFFERGDAMLASAHSDYIRARVDESYIESMGLRSVEEGLLIPFAHSDGTWMVDYGTIRLLPTRGTQKFRTTGGKGNRAYLAPGPDWAKVFEDTSIPIYWCESPIKAAALGAHGVAAIGLNGCSGLFTKNAHGDSVPVLELDDIKLKRRKNIIVFDSDVASKWQVQRALKRTTAVLTKRGGRCFFKLVPALKGEKTGVDDYVARRGFRKFKKLKLHTLDEPQFADWGLNSEPQQTDTGNAYRFAERHSDDARYVYGPEIWILCDRVGWRPDRTKQVWNLAREAVKSIGREALEVVDSDRRKDMIKWMLRCENKERLSAMLDGAATLPSIAVTPDDLDQHPMLMTVANGVVNLATGQLQQSDPHLLLTKRSPITFDADATCPRFERFIAEIMGGNPDLVAYVQRMIGYMLTGDTKEQCFFVFHGTGSNGKSTLLRILNELLGDFATSARMETFLTQQRSAGGPSEDIARLHGARVVSAVESEFGQRLAESQIKELTGQDRITARGLNAKSFSFTPQLKLVLVCNHLPVIRGGDHAIWRRVHLVPFEQTFTPKKGERLIDELRAELPGILQWAIRGCLEWQRLDELAPPKDVIRATQRYRADSDVFSQFIDECCERNEAGFVKSDEVYQVYRDWALRNGMHVMNTKVFAQCMEERGIVKRRKKSGYQYRGIFVRKNR